MDGLKKCVAEDNNGDEDSLECFTDHEQFKVVCLNKDILYTALVTMKMVQRNTLRLPLSNRYRLANSSHLMKCVFTVIPACSLLPVHPLELQLIRQRDSKVIPSCVVTVIRQTFPEVILDKIAEL